MWYLRAEPKGRRMPHVDTENMSEADALTYFMRFYGERLVLGPPIPKLSQEELAKLEVEGW